ncbi:MAG: carboxypeptidase-like regulatory domain-containing protein, partial [Puia sp.]
MKTLIIGICTALSFVANGQAPAGSVHGLVMDENKAPLEAASIALIRDRDSIPYKVVVADKSGKYVLGSIPSGNFHLLITAVGQES